MLTSFLKKKALSASVMSLLCAIGLTVTLSPSADAAPFAAGNLVIFRVGTGAAPLANTGTASFLDEYKVDGTLVQSIALPAAAGGGNQPLTVSGTATSEGALSRSEDGLYLGVAGYGVVPGTATPSAAANARIGGIIGVSGSVDTSTAIAGSGSSGNSRSAYTDGTKLWLGTSDKSVLFANKGATTATQLSTTAANIRNVEAFGGQLYASSGSGTGFVAAVGTGFPTTTGQTLANVITGTNYAYYFADLSSSEPGLDTLYTVDDTANALSKWTKTGTTWSKTGTVGTSTDAYRGVTASVSGTNVTLFLTSKGSVLSTLADTSGYGGTLGGTPTPLATAATNTAFRGIVFTPSASVAPATPPTVDSLTPKHTD